MIMEVTHPLKEPRLHRAFPAGLEDLEDFSHVILLYHFHLVKGAKLKVKPFMDQQEHGVFATRASSRPNPIGLSILRLERVEGNILYVCNIDIVDGTPLLDVKPYVPEFDIHPVERVGWLERNVHKLPSARDDGRFVH